MTPVEPFTTLLRGEVRVSGRGENSAWWERDPAGRPEYRYWKGAAYRIVVPVVVLLIIAPAIGGCSNDNDDAPSRSSNNEAPSDELPRAGAPPPVGPRTRPRPTAAPLPPPDGVSYASCAAVRAAGKAPIHRGDPGYGPHLDRNGDGIGCEGTTSR